MEQKFAEAGIIPLQIPTCGACRESRSIENYAERGEDIAIGASVVRDRDDVRNSRAGEDCPGYSLLRQLCAYFSTPMVCSQVAARLGQWVMGNGVVLVGGMSWMDTETGVGRSP